MEMSSTDPSGQLVVACFLIQEGADITTKNRNGQTPLDLCSPEMAVIAAAFSQRSTRLNNLFSRVFFGIYWLITQWHDCRSGFRGSLHPFAPKETPSHEKNSLDNTDNHRPATVSACSLIAGSFSMLMKPLNKGYRNIEYSGEVSVYVIFPHFVYRVVFHA